jgi:hypothetical protein
MRTALLALACLLALATACAIVQIGDDPTLRRIGIGSHQDGQGGTTTTTTTSTPQPQAASGVKP